MTKLSPVDRFKKGVFKTLDGPCSALALNCCQLGCFIHDVPPAAFDVYNNADWMQHLAQANPDAKLRTLVIPGTHDSGTATISKMKPFAAVGLTQNLSIFEQLNRGIRYLDIRMAGTPGATGASIFHGCLMGDPLANVLQQIATFLNEHPGEFLFLEFVCEYGKDFSPSQKKGALDLIQAELGQFLYKENNKSKMLNEATLQELIDANTRVCAMVHNRIFENDFVLDGQTYDSNYVAQTYSFFDSSKWMYNRWHNTRDDDMLLQWNLDEVHKNGSDRNKILLNQFVLTPGVGGAGDIIQLLIGMASLRPVSFAYRLIPAMEEFLRSNANEPWNIVMTDFIDLFPGLISFLVSLNFVATLEITKATVDSTEDVTDKIQPFIKRNKVLFLTNVRKDLGVSSFDGTLTIEYNLKGESKVMEVEFDDDTEVVLSEYSRFVAE